MNNVIEHPRSRLGSEIFSIFGQIESVVAEAMLKEGKAKMKIQANEIPEEAALNDFGHRALFAVLIPKQYIREFENRIADLRA